MPEASVLIDRFLRDPDTELWWRWSGPPQAAAEGAGAGHCMVVVDRAIFDPAGALVSVADKRDAGLMVIGRRRWTPVGRLILGRNAQRVLLEANCPLPTVKAES